DKNIIDMQHVNFGISNNNKKQIFNADKDDFNIKNEKKQGLHELNNSNHNYNKKGNIYMIKTCSKDIIASFYQYKTNLKT
ncbi:hypothetical protein COBT_004121, partial [Conglomerata obtusa]